MIRLIQVKLRGTPQGGVISLILANIYLHYTLDLWFEKRIKTYAQGYSRLISYADAKKVYKSFLCFENSHYANDFM